MKNKYPGIIREYRSLLLFLLLMTVFRSAFADWNHVPSGSMKPGILVGDYIFIDKMAYDFRIPFTHKSLARLGDPERGDVIIFDSKVTGNRMVKRVIGVPGDTVELRANRLIVNGIPASYTVANSAEHHLDLREGLAGQAHRIRVRRGAPRQSGFGPVRVPEGAFLALGDNRDNSADSRVIGFIPRDEIVGRAQRVVLSLDYDNFYLPRPGRFLEKF